MHTHPAVQKVSRVLGLQYSCGFIRMQKAEGKKNVKPEWVLLDVYPFLHYNNLIRLSFLSFIFVVAGFNFIICVSLITKDTSESPYSIRS